MAKCWPYLALFSVGHLRLRRAGHRPGDDGVAAEAAGDGIASASAQDRRVALFQRIVTQEQDQPTATTTTTAAAAAATTTTTLHRKSHQKG